MTLVGDVEDILDTWGTSVVVVRNTPSIGSMGTATDSWAQVGSAFLASIQPKLGGMPIREIGQEKDSTHIIFCTSDQDVQQGDKIRPATWSAGDDEYDVKRVDTWPGHIEIHADLVQGSA